MLHNSAILLATFFVSTLIASTLCDGRTYRSAYDQDDFNHDPYGNDEDRRYNSEWYDQKYDSYDDGPYSYANYYTTSGKGNNREHPRWGSVGAALLHTFPLMDWSFVDGVGKPVPTNEEHPSPRYVSNELSSLGYDTPHPRNKNRWTEFTTYWGQFLAHEMALSPTSHEPLPIQIPKCDYVFDRHCTGCQRMQFNRTEYIKGTGKHGIPRHFPNVLTAFLDGGNVYGTNPARAKAIRAFRGGKLRTTPYPPFRDGAYPPRVKDLKRDGVRLPEGEYATTRLLHTNIDELFVCGEARCNENPVLLSIHILWLREHNRVAGILAKKNAYWDDEKIFQAARKYVVAQIQKITWYEYLPSLIGRDAPKYKGYDCDVNPGVHAFFSTVAHRHGHSIVNDEVKVYDLDKNVVIRKFELRDYFFNPRPLYYRGISGILRGAALSIGGEVDGKVVDDLRNYLFGNGRPRFDLPAFNMMRAWDLGIPFYNDVRKAYDLPAVHSFRYFPTDIKGAKEKLADVYIAPEYVDPWIGGLLEAHVPGSSLGPLFENAIIDQFCRTRDGDRFWYENILGEIDTIIGGDYHGSRKLTPVQNRYLSDVIRDNTEVSYIQKNVFQYYQ